jgi:hypothetical protein
MTSLFLVLFFLTLIDILAVYITGNLIYFPVILMPLKNLKILTYLFKLLLIDGTVLPSGHFFVLVFK